MGDFFRDNYGFLTKLVECIAALTGIWCYKKFKNTNVKYFIWYLIYVACLELIGGYTVYVYKYEFLNNIEAFLKGTLFEKNYWWYTIFWSIGASLFLVFYYLKILKSHIFKRLLKLFTVIFIALSTVVIAGHYEVFFIASFKTINIFGAFLILMCTVFYFFEMLQSDKVLSFYKNLNFYISATLFIWRLIITPLVFYNIYFSKADWNFVYLKYDIYLFSNIFMYLSFTFALIYCKPEHN